MFSWPMQDKRYWWKRTNKISSKEVILNSSHEKFDKLTYSPSKHKIKLVLAFHPISTKSKWKYFQCHFGYINPSCKILFRLTYEYINSKGIVSLKMKAVAKLNTLCDVKGHHKIKWGKEITAMCTQQLTP